MGLHFAQILLSNKCFEEAFQVYERAIKGVPSEQRLSFYVLLIEKARQFYGISKVREIYDSALETMVQPDLKEGDIRSLCLDYVHLERKLGEIERARAILVFASQFANPSLDPSFWQVWNQFEVAHGNEDSFKDMLYIK